MADQDYPLADDLFKSHHLSAQGFISHSIFIYFLAKNRITLNLNKAENNISLRWKNTKEIVINHKGTRMVKDGED